VNDEAMNHESVPFISIIVAVFNGKTTLQQCLDSVAQQSYPNKELIVIDGGSEDGTVDLLNANGDKIAYCISEPDSGIYNAWNKGLAQAKGEWICFLGADDFFWDTQVLERMAEQLAKIPPAIRVVYCQVMKLSVEGKALYTEGGPWPEAKERFRQQYMSIPHPAVMHRKSLFEQHGKFDESFRIAGDYELLLRELKTGDAIFIPDIILTGVRAGGISMLTENTMKALRELGRAQRMHGQPLPGRFLLKSMSMEFVRMLLWRVLGDSSARKLLDLRRRIKGLPPHWTRT
jgi:glycosyltransferase involved in cell wall biosynthesis